jgi:hypothetical protein
MVVSLGHDWTLAISKWGSLLEATQGTSIVSVVFSQGDPLLFGKQASRNFDIIQLYIYI